MTTAFTQATRLALRSGVVLVAPSETNSPLVANVIAQTTEKVSTLSELQYAVLSRCDGTRSIGDLAREVDCSVELVLGWFDEWVELAPGMFDPVDSEPMRRLLRHNEAALRLFAAAKVRRERDTGEASAEYHRSDIPEAFDQFESIETTVSHLYRDPHPALGGRSFGTALCDAALRRAKRPITRIVEIGGGTGFVAKAFLDRLKQVSPDVYRDAEYSIIDISPVFQAAQREACREHHSLVRYLTADASTYEFDAPVDLLFANEMIADLPVALVDYRTRQVLQGDPDAASIVRRFGLNAPVDDGVAYLNVGALKLLERLVAHLAQNGMLVMSEYGTFDEAPTPVTLKGHREFSIHFGHLQRVAAELRCDTKLESLGSLLEFEPGFEVVDERTFEVINQHLLPFLGKPKLPRVAYGRAQLQHALGELFPQLSNVGFVALGAGETLSPFKFLALVVTRSKS